MKRAVTSLFLLILGSSVAFGQATFESPETGEKVLGSYFATDIDSVSLTNGNLLLNIPVFSLPGRELPLRLNMTYNSQFIEQRTVYDEFGNPQELWEFLGWRKDAGIGGTLTAETTDLGNDNYQFDIYWVAPDGSKYLFTKQTSVSSAVP